MSEEVFFFFLGLRAYVVFIALGEKSGQKARVQRLVPASLLGLGVVAGHVCFHSLLE